MIAEVEKQRKPDALPLMEAKAMWEIGPRRILNIASIVCLVVCVVFVGLWVRSYHAWSELRGRWIDTRAYSVESILGRLILHEFNLNPGTIWPSMLDGGPIDNSMRFPDPHLQPGLLSPLGIQTYFSEPASAVIVPHWLLVLASGSLAMLCQLRWPLRFTLRSLFIATTFLAIVLGMSAWLDRAWIGK
jgi:hypothetical protein